MAERMFVFVDVINLFGAVKSVHNGRKIDYEKYYDRIEDEGDVIGAFAYGAYVADETNGFIECLQRARFRPNYVKAEIFNDQPDVRRTDRTKDMICDIAQIMDRADTIVLGTLNINMIPVIDLLKARGIKVILYSCNVKRELKEAADEYWFINETVLEEPHEGKVESDTSSKVLVK